jgi:hypothetical protein
MSDNIWAELAAEAAANTALRWAAKTYAGANIPVFPVQPGDKTPLFPNAHPDKDDPLRGTCKGECGRLGHGFHDATVDLDTISEWWDRYPEANIGIRPWPRIAVIDVDVADGKPGRATFDRLIGELGPLPDTWTAETATGGLHIWLNIGDTAHVNAGIGPAVDIKIGRTGYLVAAPSKRPQGEYAWLRPGPDGLPSGLPAVAPDTWRARIVKPPPRPRQAVKSPALAGRNPAYVKAAVDSELAKLGDAIAGHAEEGRRPTLFRVACKVLGFEKAGHVKGIRAVLHAWAMSHGFNEQDIDRQLENAWNLAEQREIPVLRTHSDTTTFTPQEAS